MVLNDVQMLNALNYTLHHVTNTIRTAQLEHSTRLGKAQARWDAPESRRVTLLAAHRAIENSATHHAIKCHKVP